MHYSVLARVRPLSSFTYRYAGRIFRLTTFHATFVPEFSSLKTNIFVRVKRLTRETICRR